MALNQREKRLLAIPLILGVGFAFYNWVHVPLFERRAEASSHFDKVTADLKKDQSRLSKEGNLTVRKEAVAAREKVIDAWVPGKDSAALFIWYLSQAELHSGAHIKGITVGDRKQFTATPQQGAKGPAQPPQQQQQPPQQAQPNQGTDPNAQPAPDSGAAPTLMVVELELKVEARFAQHLLFNQAIEEMPLFLNTNALNIAKKDEKLPLEEAGKLIQGGNAQMAAQLLSASPSLNGTYKIALYFKGDKAGPSTDPMSFAQSAGRIDPFVQDGIDEFLRTLIQYYSGKYQDPATPSDPLIIPTRPGESREQMG